MIWSRINVRVVVFCFCVCSKHSNNFYFGGYEYTRYLLSLNDELLFNYYSNVIHLIVIKYLWLGIDHTWHLLLCWWRKLLPPFGLDGHHVLFSLLPGVPGASGMGVSLIMRWMVLQNNWHSYLLLFITQLVSNGSLNIWCSRAEI